MESRRADLDRFYAVIGALADRLGGPRRLATSSASTGWPPMGVYFFFEPGEFREDGRTPRVVRVGTHAVSAGSKRTLWNRLSAHKGTMTGAFAGGGNHRASVFRLHVGRALLASGRFSDPVVAETWGQKSSASREVRERELALERAVSAYIGEMPVLWLPVSGDASKTNDRSIIESGAIALVSNLDRPAVDPPSPSWLGNFSPHPRIRASGLWNVRHVDEQHREGFMTLFEHYGERAQVETE